MNERRMYVNFVRYLTLKRENLRRAKIMFLNLFGTKEECLINNTSTIFEVGTIFWDLTLSNNNMNSTLSTIATGLCMSNITSFSCCSVLFHRCSQLLLLPLGIPNRYYLYFTTDSFPSVGHWKTSPPQLSKLSFYHNIFSKNHIRHHTHTGRS